MNYEDMECPEGAAERLAARHCWYGASFPSKAELDGIDEIGEDRVLWGNDYPHYEGTFPYNLESLRLTFADMPDARRRKMLGENAAALYKFDLKKLRPLAAAYGPTPAQVEHAAAARRTFRATRLLPVPDRPAGGSKPWAMPADIGIVDTMIGFPAEDFRMYDFIRAQLKESSAEFDFPVEYMFKHVPKELYGVGRSDRGDAQGDGPFRRRDGPDRRRRRGQPPRP